MSQPGNKTLGQKIWRVISGFEIAVVCLALLFLLTFFGTIEQKWVGLYAVIQKYFDIDSFLVFPSRGDGKFIFFPLPGAYWVMVVLSINMFCGGLIRARKGWRTVGVLISHFAILFMLIAGAVSSLSKVEGQMSVYQGEISDYAQKYHTTTIEVAKYDDKGNRMAPKIVPSKTLRALKRGDVLHAEFPEEEFTMDITGMLGSSNLFLEKSTERIKEDGPVVDGFFIREAEYNKNNELANMAGCYVTVKDKQGEEIQELILWMGNPSPVSFVHNGQRYAVTLTMEVWPMPFEVELHKTIGEYYPGTRKASSFESTITKVANDHREDYKIIMNHPMRHGGFTLFQANWSDTGGRPFSGFAIVTNPSDKWPEYSLYVATVGLLIHFLIMLFRFGGGRSNPRKSAES
ncbi:cytochrome c biogenesis protein ResB [Akkermansiaceae bacterium]|nr:cytochrome c biogenesis protein ResB [Akkermansiaceae bacterium]MDB4537911.1 cytochrome c biogenesis protein ResB [Akkermansiaceae bacterium]